MFTRIPAERFKVCPSPDRVVAVIDPRAGRGMGHRVMYLLQQRTWPADVKIFNPDPLNLNSYIDAIQHARDWGADRLLIAGGDGTLMRAMTAMLQTGPSIPLSVIPTGTGNVVAGALHLPKRIFPALRLAFGMANLHWWDVGHLVNSDYYFALRASAGHDANTLAYVTKQAKLWWRTMAYVGPAIMEFLRMKPIRFSLTLDEQPPVEVEGATAFVAVTSRLAGQFGFVLSTQMRTDDGVLYAGVIHPQKILQNLPRLIHHMALEAENFEEMVTLFPVKRRVIIDCDEPQRTQIDGELLDQTPLVAEVVPHGVPFVTAPHHMYKTARFSSYAHSTTWQ